VLVCVCVLCVCVCVCVRVKRRCLNILRISIPFPVGYTYQNNYLTGKHFEQQCFRHSAGSHVFFYVLVTESFFDLTSVQIAEIFGLKCHFKFFNSISPALNYTAHEESSVY